MKYIDIPFGPYEPDWGGLPRPESPGYLVDAVNIRPTRRGYRGQPTFTTHGVAIESSGTVGNSVQIQSGNANFFAIVTVGADGRVYQANNTAGAWSDVSLANCDPSHYTDIIHFGNSVVIPDGSTSTRTAITKSLGAAVGTAFAAMSEAPQARIGARVRQHLVFGQVWDGGAIDEYLVRWGAIGTIDDWPTPGTSEARSKEAGKQVMPEELGIITRIIGGEKFGIVAQERGLTRMTYVGGSAVFEFDTYENKYGCHRDLSSGTGGIGPTPFVNVGPSKWVWMQRDVGVFITDGYSVEKLSDGIDDSLFLDALSHDDAPFPVNSPMSGAYDRRRKQVIFWCQAGTGTDTHLAFSMETGQFSLLQDSTAGVLFEGRTSANDGTPILYKTTTSRVLNRLTADAGQTIAIQTGFMELEPGFRIQLHGAHLLGTGVPGSLTLAYKVESDYDNLSTAQTGFTSMTAAGRGNKATARADGQFVSFRITGTGKESQLIRGIRVYYEKTTPA